MHLFDKALVIIDPMSDKHAALTRALYWEHLFDLHIELLAADVAESMLLEEYLEQIAEPLREQGVDIGVTALSGNPNYELLLRHICHVSQISYFIVFVIIHVSSNIIYPIEIGR